MPRGKSKKKQLEEKKLNTIVLIMIILAVLSGVLIYMKTGVVGETISPALGGVLGYIKYLIPPGLFLMGVYLAVNKEMSSFPKRLWKFIAILILIDAVLACYQFSQQPPLIDTNSEFGSVLSRAYELGTTDIGGGVIGTVPAFLLSKLVGNVCAVIVFVGALLVLVVRIFNVQVADRISNSASKIQERTNNIRERRRAAVEEVEEEEVEEEEEPKHRTFLDKLFHKGDDEEEAEEEDEEEINEQITINLNNTNKKKKRPSPGMVVPDIHTGKKIKKRAGVASIKDIDAGSEEELFTKKKKEKEEEVSEELNLQHGLTEEEYNYDFPPINILADPPENVKSEDKKSLLATAEKLRKTLQSFGVSAKVENVSVGPAITRFELAPAQGVRVNKISNLADDIALALEAETIRIEAPIPGKHTVGIEVPNKFKSVVGLKEIIESDQFQNAKSKLTMALGKDVAGDIIVTDIAKMPHVLIAGATGSGKSVCINTLITSIIYKAKPSEVKLLMVDPKIVELSVYNGIPHLLIPVVTDAKKAAGALNWAVQEMENRYNLFAKCAVRNIQGYNDLADSKGEPKLPHMVIIIDELADLMMVAAKEVEDAICRLAQKARAAGMHLVIATQRPSVDVITGIIKANIPSRIAFAVSSQVDSRTILDGAGAEKLLGKGDMLFYPSGDPKPTRIQGAFISDGEVENLVKFVKKDGDNIYDSSINEFIENNSNPEQVKKKKGEDDEDDDGTDELLEEAINYVIQYQTASATFLQTKLKVGYSRARRILDQIEERGIISGYQGSKPRTVLITPERWEELNAAPTSGGRTSDDDEEYEDEEYDDSEEYEDEEYEEDDSEEYEDEDEEEYEDDEESDDEEYEDDEEDEDDEEYEEDDEYTDDDDNVEYEDEEDIDE